MAPKFGAMDLTEDSVETWATMFATNSLAVEAGAVGVAPGLGRHQLTVGLAIRPTDAAAFGHEFVVGGRVDASGLTGGGGYLGTAHRTRAVRLNANSRADVSLFVDLDPGQIEAVERRRNGAFSLNLNLEFWADREDGGTEYGTAQIINHPVSRESWLTVLEQTRYRRTLLLELAVPEAHASPHIAKALEYLADAQRRLLEGENRLTVESLRQCLAALVGKAPEDEDDPETIAVTLKDARQQTFSTRVGYAERFEVVRRALKFLADLGAHPEVVETTPAEARSALTMLRAFCSGTRNNVGRHLDSGSTFGCGLNSARRVS